MIKLMIPVAAALLLAQPAFGASCRKAKTETACVDAQGCSWNETRNKCSKQLKPKVTQAKKQTAAAKRAEAAKKADAAKANEESAPSTEEWEMDLDLDSGDEGHWEGDAVDVDEE